MFFYRRRPFGGRGLRAKSSTSVPLTSGRSVNSRKTSLNEPKNARKEVAITGPTEVPRMLHSRFFEALEEDAEGAVALDLLCRHVHARDGAEMSTAVEVGVCPQGYH